MPENREKRISAAVRALWASLESVRNDSGWERKLLAASYVHHRDSYPGTLVPYRQTYDSSAVDFLNTFLSGFVGYMMPQDDTWAELVPMSLSYGAEASRRKWAYQSIGDLDADPGVLRFSERCIQAVMACYANSDYYPEMRMMAKDYLVFGTGYIMACDGSGTDGVSFRCFDPQEVCIAENEARKVNVFVRKFTMDARDVVAAYPDKPWPNLRQRIRAGGGERSDVQCWEAIVPRDYLRDGEGRMEILHDGAFGHVMCVEGEDGLCFESGFASFPVAAVRRNRDNAKSPYGIGLVEECLAVIIELDDMGRIRQVMRQKNADPPMVLIYALQGHFSSRPGARNYVSDMSQAPAPAVDHYNANELLADIQDMRGQLRSLMGADLFRTVMGSTDSRKTAYEVSERKNEAMTLLQMQIGTFKQEGVEPVLKRTLYLLERKGWISFEEYERRTRDSSGRIVSTDRMTFQKWLAAAHVELNSVFVRRVEAYLQYQQNVQALQIVTAIQPLFPSALLNIDENMFIRSLMYGAGTPKAVMRELADTEKKQADYAQKMNQQAEAERLTELSGAAKNLSAPGMQEMMGQAMANGGAAV